LVCDPSGKIVIVHLPMVVPTRTICFVCQLGSR
jgi:hypothetical protein